MRKVLARFVVPFVAVAVVGLLAGAPTAGALAPTAHSPSFIGSYTVHGTIDGSSVKPVDTLNVFAGGAAENGAGSPGSWSNSGKVFTVVFVGSTGTFTYGARQTKKGIASKKHPGTWHGTNGSSGTWYAVRTPMAAAPAPSAHPSPFVGTYKVHVLVQGTTTGSTWKIHANGQFTVSDGTSGTWTTSGREIILTSGPYTFAGDHTKTGINTKQHQGKIAAGSDFFGTWYGVKQR